MRTLGVDYLKVELPVDISAAFREVAEVGRGRPAHADAPRLPREVRVDLAQVRPQVGVPRGSVQPVVRGRGQLRGEFLQPQNSCLDSVADSASTRALH